MITYTIGNEHSPGDPFGRIVLTIDPDGSAKLEHHSRTGDGAWTGDVEPEVVDRLVSELERAGFPQVPQHFVPAGSAMRELSIGEDDDVDSAIMTERLGNELDGYKEAFRILDSLAVQLSSGAYQGGKDSLGPSVSNVRAL